MEKRNGFTLIETVVVMFMLSITMAAFYSVYRMQTRSLKGQEYRLEAQQTARSALDFMVRELRNARYNPRSIDSGASCGDEAAGKPGIITATATTLHFSYDADGSEDCDQVGENIKYTFDNIARDIKRKDAKLGGNGEELTDGNVKQNGLTLAYFDQDDNPLTSFPLNAADRDSIQRVSITVTIDSKNMADEFGGKLSAVMTTNVDLRNPA